MENYIGFERRRELNELEREHKENIRSINSDYFDSLKDIREEMENKLKENHNNYIERENEINYRRRKEKTKRAMETS